MDFRERLILCVEPKQDADYITRDYLDLQLYVRLMVTGNSSIRAYDGILSVWGITEDELFDVAKENTKKDSAAANVFELFSRVFECGHEDDAPELLVLTNSYQSYGAGVIAVPDCMGKVADIKGKDLYILPSSIHELMVTPDNGVLGPSELRAIVKDVNDTQVSPEDLLSYNVYKYSRSSGEISVCS